MTEAEKKSFFAHTTTRAPGKRQIKPTAAVLDIVINAEDEEDDEDFVAEKTFGSDGSESESSSSSGEDSDNEDEEGDAEEDEEGVSDVKESAEQDGLICALCLNLRDAVKVEDIMQCDRCGLAVHESCYLPELADDSQSESSSSSTEPWFCEPCTYGCVEPPNCELCPSRLGALKISDIGGRWAHMICGLYTRGVTFGDLDHLSAISWQEMDHRNFGRKSCAGCTDKLEARTGVATRCELGLCKEYYHATCAQRLGLLVDLVEQEQNDNHIDPRYINCKKHSNPDDVRVKKAACAKFLRQEEKRLLNIRRKVLTEREERKRQQAYKKCKKAHEALVGVTICWPDASFDKHDKKVKRARQLHTSARYLEAFKEKAELIDVDKDQFEQEFLRVKGDSLPFLSPGFSDQFIEYFENREKHTFPAEEKRLKALQAANEESKKQQDFLLAEFKRLEAANKAKHQKANESKELLNRFFLALSKLGVKKLKKPECLNSPQELSPTRKNRTMSHSNGSPLLKPAVSVPATKLKPIEKITLHACKECSQNSDQHLLIQCDSCGLHYHLRCLDPPLEKMPKKTNCDWYCSVCCESDHEEEEEEIKKEVEDEDSSNDGIKPRKLRRRNDLAKAKRKLEAEEQDRAYKAAISSGGRVPRKSKEPMPSTSKNVSLPLKRRTLESPAPNGLHQKKRKTSTTPPQLQIGAVRNGRSSVLSGGSSNSGRSNRGKARLSCDDDDMPVLEPEAGQPFIPLYDDDDEEEEF